MNTNPPSATSARYKQELGNIARRRLLNYPDQQAEIIARHYVAHARSAQALLQLVESRKHVLSSPDVDSVIQRLVDEIKNNHWHDFGIELDWPNLAE